MQRVDMEANIHLFPTSILHDWFSHRIFKDTRLTTEVNEYQIRQHNNSAQ